MQLAFFHDFATGSVFFLILRLDVAGLLSHANSFFLENIELSVYEQTFKNYNCFDIYVGFAVGITLF